MDYIDDYLVEGIVKIANARIKRDYPLMNEPFKVGEVKYICEAMYELSELILKSYPKHVGRPIK